ncbi:pyridoxal-dependent decarboxylase, exosortase A system-associated [Sphingomonas glaciei]|uniref:Pyridoxal-dependent decarboxylase, exosortase A system-associated n=1 Tax=Sphingomonas glaciei TaxID=2938948 RepID=A0ABY5MXQ6_9SPHN|nr:pyridoxal-dependent decarboxylase, exosortase A system-associated [Sphingomonas glaciei]UUR08269.1 pyridoxal-dependent decarboxylase, exosortase A system-associated [Sphingomonas glaciei]
MKAMGPVSADFLRGGGDLSFGGKSAEELIAAHGAPLFVYNHAIIDRQAKRYRAAFAGVGLHYAVKANPFAPLMQHMAGLVDGLDLASSGELVRVEAAGLLRPDLPLSFAGPGKTSSDLAEAVQAGVCVHVESENELERLLAIAKLTKQQASIGVRVNPPFGLKGSGMKMGGLASQFGVDHEAVPGLVRRIVEAGAEWRGLHVYAGSQSLSAEAVIDMQRATVALAGEIATEVGLTPPEVNLGGGFGIPYFAGDKPLDIEAVGAALEDTLANRPLILAGTNFVIELGRWLVGECGVYLTRVVDRKVSRGKTFLVVDGGLHHMLAASGNFGQLLRRNYPVAVANRFGDEPEEEVTVVGCLCTPLDLLADEVALPRAEVGDVIAIFCAGAYGLTASPQAFLSQGAAREVLV